MPYIYQLFLVIFLFLINRSILNAEQVNFQIKGLSGILEKNVRAQLSSIHNEEIADIIISNNFFRARIDQAIRNGLKALGYYEPKIDINFFSIPEEKQKIVDLNIDPGTPVRIKKINIILRGDGSDDPDFLKLLKNIPVNYTVLNHRDYDDFKNSLINLATKKGYFDGHFNISQLSVSLIQHQAFWNIDYDSGKRYRFGEINLQGSQICEKYIKNIIPFKWGDPYLSEKLIELHRRLSATGWFQSVSLEPEFDKFHQEKILSFQGKALPRVKNTIETGIGYSNGLGLRWRGSWKKPWINSHGHSLIISSSISNPEQLLMFSHKIPLIKNPIEQYYLVKGEFKHSYIHDIRAYSSMFSISRYWDYTYAHNWKTAFSLNWSFDHFIKNKNVNTSMLLYSEIAISRTRARGNIMPEWGDTQQYSLNYSNTYWGSDVNFIAFKAKNVWIRTIFYRNRFVLRGNFGWIITNNFNKIPLDLHFFSGGDISIRGYRYKFTIPENMNKKSINASILLTGSFEYQFNIFDKWWSSVFLDAGETIHAIHNNYNYESNKESLRSIYNNQDFVTGIGIGVRWKSPIGPMKIDFGIPIFHNKKYSLKFFNSNKRCFQFYIGFGPEL